MGVSRILLVFAIVIGMAMFVVRERNEVIGIGYRVAALQKNCEELTEKKRKLEYHVKRLKSPEIIAYKVQSLKLPLVPREETSGIIMMGQTKYKENMMNVVKAGSNKGLYTQKNPYSDCCSLHN